GFHRPDRHRESPRPTGDPHHVHHFQLDSQALTRLNSHGCVAVRAEVPRRAPIRPRPDPLAQITTVQAVTSFHRDRFGARSKGRRSRGEFARTGFGECRRSPYDGANDCGVFPRSAREGAMDHRPSVDLLESIHYFPGVYKIKAIGRADDDFESRVVDAVCSHRASRSDLDYSVRSTPGGRHLAVTLDIGVQTAEQVRAIYAELREVKGLTLLF